MLNKEVNKQAKMSRMDRLRKKNEMLNYFVDRRKKKKPSVFQRAKKLALEKKQKDNNEIQENTIGEDEGDKEEEGDKGDKEDEGDGENEGNKQAEKDQDQNQNEANEGEESESEHGDGDENEDNNDTNQNNQDEVDLHEKMELTIEHTLFKPPGQSQDSIIFDIEAVDGLEEHKKVTTNLEAREKVISYIKNGQQIDPYCGNKDSTIFIRDYVDHFISKLFVLPLANDINERVKFIITKLKDFFIHKMKVTKKKLKAGALRKRFLFGMHEVFKMLEMGKAKLIIISRNIMKVEEKGGFDEYLLKIIELARKEKVPVVFSMTKYQLGMIALKRGFN